MKSNIVKTKLWRTKHLGDVCDVEYGYTDKAISRGEYRFVRITDTDENGLLTVENRMYVNSFDEADKYILADGDLLMARVGASAGNVLLFKGDEKSVFASYLIRLRFKKEIISELYWYFAKSNLYWEQVKRLSAGAAQPQFNGGSLKKICITYPEDLSEQRRIVKILDEVFGKVAKAKENAEKNLKNSKELFESYLQSVFISQKYEKKMLGEICDTGAGGTPLKSRGDYYEDGNIPWLRSGEVCQKEIIEHELFITEKGLKDSSAKLFPENTVLIAMYGATAGQTGILRFPSTTNQAVCGILPSKDFVPEYLYYYFSAKKNDLVKQAVGGAQPNISQMKIRNTFVPVVALHEQKAIVRKLDALSAETKKLEGVYAMKLADLEELKKTVLRSAFAGKL